MPQPAQALQPVTAASPAVADARLAPAAAPARLVEVANLNPEDLAAAQASAAKLDFRNTTSLLAHGDGVLAGIAGASRQLLTGVRLGDAGRGRAHRRRGDRRRQNPAHLRTCKRNPPAANPRPAKA